MQSPSQPPRLHRRAALACLLSPLAVRSVGRAASAESIALSPSTLDLKNVTATTATYRGRKALKLVESNAAADVSVAALKGVEFRDGTIELAVAGTVAAGASEGARGFIGVAFRTKPDASVFEYMYLRPTNGRADDQVRRNHSAQYASHPEYPWQRLRKEAPEKYESYVDLEPGAWTPMKIVVAGTTAKLFVHGAEQPCLVVKDLKLGAVSGGIALWIGPGTDGYFTDLKVIRE